MVSSAFETSSVTSDKLDITMLRSITQLGSSHFRRFIYNSTHKCLASVCSAGFSHHARHLRPRGSTCALSDGRSKTVFGVSGDVINSFSEADENGKFRIFPFGEIRRQLDTQIHFQNKVEAPVCSAGYSRHSTTTYGLEHSPAR